MFTPSRVLWIRFGAFGDVLQAVARARLFKRRFPNARLTMLTRPEFANIVEPQDCFENFVYWDSKHNPSGLLKCVADVRSKHFDTLVSVHNAVSAAFVAKLSGIPHTFGYKSMFESFYYGKNVWKWFEELGIDKDLRDTPMVQPSQRAKEYAARLYEGFPEKRLFCITMASKLHKFWPVEYWPQLLNRLIADGWYIVLNGHGEEERKNNGYYISQITDKSKVLDLTDKLNYDQMCAAIQACKAAVGVDTGPLNLAGLSGTPTLGLFGCTPSQKLGFTMPWYREVLTNCPTPGCWNYDCPKPCMALLTPDMAYDGFKKFEEELLA